jgi:hypothetical protein
MTQANLIDKTSISLFQSLRVTGCRMGVGVMVLRNFVDVLPCTSLSM